MEKLPDYLIYLKKERKDKLQIRRIGRKNEEVGIQVSQEMYDFPFERGAEFFIKKQDAINLIRALMKYFSISMIHIKGDEDE